MSANNGPSEEWSHTVLPQMEQRDDEGEMTSGSISTGLVGSLVF